MVNWHNQGVEGLSFDDVLIRPQYSEIRSREECEPSMRLICQDGQTTSKSIWPIIAANMTSIATMAMTRTLTEEKVIVPTHRFCKPSEQLCILRYTCPTMPSAASIGLDDRERVDVLLKYGVCILFLELAHAGTQRAVEEVRWLRKQFPQGLIVAGNIATYETAKPLFDAGADYVKVGVGPGSVCQTRSVTGVGVPQLSAIMDCARAGKIIADGGIRCSGDIVKALAAGAEMVMIGSLLAGTTESLRDMEGKPVYFGMASEEAGKVKPGFVPEGICVRKVKHTGSAAQVILDLVAGIRQGMSMVGARTLKELREKAIFEKVSSNTVIENSTHFNLTHK